MPPLEYIKKHVCVPSFPGWSTGKKCCILYGCVMETAARVSVDLGAFGGRAAISMGFGHRQQGFGVCYAVDAWDNAVAAKNQKEPANKTYWEKVPMAEIHDFFMKARQRENIVDYVKVLKMEADKAALEFEDNSVDVLHFDADHSEEASVRDIIAWLPKVRAGGYVCFDDTDWTEGDVVTTAKAQQMLLDAGYVITHTEAHDDEGNEWKMFQKPMPIQPTGPE